MEVYDSEVNMTTYECNDCEDEEPYTGTCQLILPDIAGKPTDCPVYGDGYKCNWLRVI
jgi:hypothetical protein